LTGIQTEECAEKYE